MDDAIPVTIEMLKPSDRIDGYPSNTPKWLRKILEIFPGLFTWTLIFSPLIIAILGLYEIMIYYIAFLSVYWSYRGIRFVIGLYIAKLRTDRDIAIDWIGKIKTEFPEQYKDLKYVYICPVYREGMETLRPTIESWAESDIDTKKISVVFALEEKFAEDEIKNFEILREEFGDKFREMIHFVHPNNIEGEVSGVKGANINWATRNFVKMIEKRGETKQQYLLITCDSDLRPHPKYLSAITHKYFATPDRDNRFYATAIHAFNNNLWRVPPLVRTFSTTLTLVVAHSWVVTKKSKETFSSYVVNLETVHKVGYWAPDVGIDDTTFFWNALIRLDGNFSGEEVYIPTNSDAVENESVVKTHVSLYKQQHRWGWGIIVLPSTIAALLYNKTIPLPKKLEIFWQLLDNQILFLTVVYMITFALPLLNFFSKEFASSSASYNLPIAMSYILTFVTFLNIPIAILKHYFMPVPKHYKWWQRIIEFVETVLVTVNMLTFGFIPFIQAQTELMFGKQMKKKFYATDKVAIKKQDK